MSLLGNRGRFTQDKNNNFDNNVSEYNSVLSLIGKNPTRLFKISSEIKKNVDIKERLKNVNLDNEENYEYNSHQEYNKRINQLNSKINMSVNKAKGNSVLKKRKTSPKVFIAMFIIEVLTIIGIYFVGSVYRYSNLPQPIPFNKKNVENTEITESTLAIMKGYKTAAIFGVDSRTGSVDKGNNADVNMIVNLNLETGDAQLISVYRDLYLSVTDNNLYDKLNAAYRRGGPEQAVKTLNKNLDLNIDSYFAFNWKAVADGIELLGGIDLEISKSEYTYMNAFIHETCIATGIDSKNPAAHYIKKSGMQRLDGVQAVAYGRLRLMDSDFQRVERQKKVIALCLEKAKTLDIPKLRLITEAVLPQIAYAFDMNEMLSLLRIVRNINITESAGFPDVNNVVTMSMGGSGDCVVPLNLEKAVVKLHKILFNVDDYSTSNSVKRYSNRITELRAKYTEENRVNESIKESSKLESLNDATKTSDDSETKTRPRISSSSNTKATNPIPVSAPNDLRIVDADSYPEEPENDAPIETSANSSNNTNNNVPNNNVPNNSVPNNSVPNNNSPSNNSPNNSRPTETTVSQVAPGSGDYTVYDAPGVPRNQSNTSNSPNNSNPINAPTNNTQNSNTQPNNGNDNSLSNSEKAVVVNGPPGSDIVPNTTTNNQQNFEETVVVPIITAPN